MIERLPGPHKERKPLPRPTFGLHRLLLEQGRGHHSKGRFMVSLSGKTVNGDTYEGIYANASPDRITWAATFRRNGIFFGMRHGRINGLLGIPTDEVDAVVKDDIEEAWFN